MAPGASGWFRRRTPRLSGSLHVRDAAGRELIIPLRGRASVLTGRGTELGGYGEVWAVHTGSTADRTSLMIVYGPAESAGDRHSGLCAAGQTVTLGGADFTWRAAVTAPSRPDPDAAALPAQRNRIPHPRTAGPGVPRNVRVPAARGTNTRAEPARIGGLRDRIRNMVRIVTQATRSPE